ncbi:L-arabinokinase-like protein [Tanacetum coccineum]
MTKVLADQGIRPADLTHMNLHVIVLSHSARIPFFISYSYRYIKVEPGLVLRGPLENTTNKNLSNCKLEVCPMKLIHPPEDCNVNSTLSFALQGIDSGLRHSIGGADYGSVRIGAFMGGNMIKSTASDISLQSYSNGIGNNPDELEDLFFNLSDTLSGEAFLTKYDHHNGPVTVIDKNRSYGVKAFKALLTSISSKEQPTALGDLMYKCHYSYSACGLGSDEMDRLVQLVQEMHHRKPSVSRMDRLVQLVQETQHINHLFLEMEPYTGQKSRVVDPVAPFM